MIDVAIMIEGQNGLDWERWRGITQVVEGSGYVGLFRSDHYTNARPPDKDSLELWVSLTWLAGNTQRIDFGPLVSPVSFRHPTMTARMAAAVDDLSGGRMILGLGAGWQEREHNNFGWDLLDVDGRFNRFKEGLEVITRLLESDSPVDFEGDYFNLNEAILLPRPNRPGGPPVLIGGNGPLRTLPLVAKYASEWNAIFAAPQELKTLNAKLDELLEERGRRPEDVRRSMMTGCVFGRDRAEVERKVKARGAGDQSISDLRQRGLLVGTAAEMIDQLSILEEAGLQRVMLQWLDLDDLGGLERMAKGIFL